MRQIENILIIFPPNYNHYQVFCETALSFQAALKQLGQYPQIRLNAADCDGTTLVFGAHLLSKFDGTIEGDQYILFQSEQLSASDSLFVDEKYLDILRRHEVWDYSPANIEFLTSKGVEAKYVPIGYNRVMSNIKTGRSAAIVGGAKNGPARIELMSWSGAHPPTGDDGKFIQDVDVCFYGSMNHRRAKIIDALKASVVSTVTTDGEIVDRPLVVAQFSGYGGYRDKVIARSKIVLNMHYYDSAIFEIFRCSHLFANKKCVISEEGLDSGIEMAYRATGGFVKYDHLVDACLEVLRDSVLQNTIAQKGYDIFTRTSQADNIRVAL